LPPEVASQAAAIVTESTARRLWPGRDPLAKVLTVDGAPRPVVGVARDMQVSRLGLTDTPFVFLPPSASSRERGCLLVALAAGGPSLTALRAVVRTQDPDLAVDAGLLSDNLELWRAPSRLFCTVATLLALLALILACTGVFGTVAYTVSRRVREIGIRVALGAARGDVLRLIVREGMRPVVIGILAGAATAAASANLLASMLFGLSPRDPLAFAAGSAGLFLVALAACYVPARRALGVEPTVALRTE